MKRYIGATNQQKHHSQSGFSAVARQWSKRGKYWHGILFFPAHCWINGSGFSTLLYVVMHVLYLCRCIHLSHFCLVYSEIKAWKNTQPCDFGVICPSHNKGPQIRGLCSEKQFQRREKEKKSTLWCPCSGCFSPLHKLRKCGFPGSPNMVKQKWGVQQMSHQAPTRTILACVQDGEGEKADR